MSVHALRKERPSGRFSKSRGLSASVSILSSPPPPALLLVPFFARFLTLFPCSLLLNRTETLATQARVSAECSVRPRGRGVGTPYDGLYGKAPPERDSIFRYQRVEISLAEVYER